MKNRPFFDRLVGEDKQRFAGILEEFVDRAVLLSGVEPGYFDSVEDFQLKIENKSRREASREDVSAMIARINNTPEIYDISERYVRGFAFGVDLDYRESRATRRYNNIVGIFNLERDKGLVFRQANLPGEKVSEGHTGRIFKVNADNIGLAHPALLSLSMARYIALGVNWYQRPAEKILHIKASPSEQIDSKDLLQKSVPMDSILPGLSEVIGVSA